MRGNAIDPGQHRVLGALGEPPAKLRAAIQDIGLARLEQLKDVLTPAQFNRYQQKREEKLEVPTVRGYQGTPPPSLGNRNGEE